MKALRTFPSRKRARQDLMAHRIFPRRTFPSRTPVRQDSEPYRTFPGRMIPRRKPVREKLMQRRSNILKRIQNQYPGRILQTLKMHRR